MNIQRWILIVGASLVGLSCIKISIILSFVIGLGLGTYVYVRTIKDVQYGFYLAVVGDRLFVRTGVGEVSVLISEVDRLDYHNEEFALFLKGGGKIDIEGLTKDFEPAYRWMYINLKTPFKSPPRA